MVYLEYIDYKNKYNDIQKIFDGILNEKEQLFLITQPKASKIEGEKVNGGVRENLFDRYLIMKDEKQIDTRLEEARTLLKDREHMLDLKEAELRDSKDWHDIIFVYYYIERLSIRKIAKKIPFSTTEIFRKIKKIEKNINLEQKVTKIGLQ
jgi:AraC-like DNA-binding protein